MPITNNKIYMIDDKPVSPKELIEQAKIVDEEFGEDGFLLTSVAAGILKNSGYVVEENPEYQGNSGA